jgi:hypothetical protein
LIDSAPLQTQCSLKKSNREKQIIRLVFCFSRDPPGVDGKISNPILFVKLFLAQGIKGSRFGFSEEIDFPGETPTAERPKRECSSL